MAVAEACFGRDEVGAEISVESAPVGFAPGLNEAGALFGESASRVVISATRALVGQVLERAAAARVPARAIGHTGGRRLRITVDGRTSLDVLVADAERVWMSALGELSARRVA
jgi:hypothetical protein